MGKKVSKVKKKDNKKNVFIGIKKYDKENILVILLLVIFFVWGMLLIIRYYDYNNINRKIDEIDELESNIKLLNNGYIDIENGIKRINDITNKNNKLNNDIDGIVNDIDELSSKISKYSK